MDEFKEIARRMAELNLQGDVPFTEPLAPDWKAELNAKLKPKPPPDQGDEVVWDGGC